MAERSPFPIPGCKEYEQDLVLYYYGEAKGNEQDRIEAHLRNCEACRASLEELKVLLPSTVIDDHPPQSFWDDYSREFRGKLDRVQEQTSWWERISAFVGPWPVPAVATALVLLLAVTLTLTRTLKSPNHAPPMNQELLEIFSMADNADFLRNLELLDSLELLEAPGILTNSSESA